MSPVMTSAKPAARAICAQAITPAAGPDSAVRTGSRGGGVERHHAAVALHDQQLAGEALAAQIVGQPLQVAADHRLQHRVQRGGGTALELADLVQHLGWRR